MKNRSALIRLFCVHLWLTLTVAAQAPEILKVDPPSWWTMSTANPVRLMIRGRNLQSARVQVVGQGLKIVSTPKINQRGTYLFVDVFIDPNAVPRKRSLAITTARGSVRVPFEVLAPLDRMHDPARMRRIEFSQVQNAQAVKILRHGRWRRRC